MKPLHVALLVIGAMLVGAGISYWTIRQMPPPFAAAPAVSAPMAPPPPQPPDVAGIVPEPPGLDESEIDAAIEAAKAARARGETKPVAATPEEFARELGAFNFQLVEFLAQFPEAPAQDPAAEKLYRERLEALTKHYASLSVDEGLLIGAEDGTPRQLAHLQAHLAAGSLGLDAAGTSKLEEILARVYGQLFPVAETDPEAEKKLDAATNEITRAITDFLSPEQQKRLDLMGADQVLFGLPNPEPSSE